MFKSEIFMSCWLFKIICTPCYISSNKEEILSAVEKTGHDIIWQFKWLRLSMRRLGTPRYTLGIDVSRYNVLISRKLQYITSLWSRINQLYLCVLLIFSYAYALPLNINTPSVPWKLVKWFKAEMGEGCGVFYIWHS